jgi:hypothetical protein
MPLVAVGCAADLSRALNMIWGRWPDLFGHDAVLLARGGASA